jgi:hypothetical protein
MRAWHDRFDGRRPADRLEEQLGRNRFTADEGTVIESRTMFFFALPKALHSRASWQQGDPEADTASRYSRGAWPFPSRLRTASDRSLSTQAWRERNVATMAPTSYMPAVNELTGSDPGV